MKGTIRPLVLRTLLLSACLASLTACTFYVGGSDAGTREGEKAAQSVSPSAQRSA